ncbi:MAG: glutathione S-transferase family protein [Kofleriaceae bacterium]
MSLIFYSAPMSTATLTELVIEELGVPCDRKLLDIKAGDTKKPEFVKVNPNGKVPTIVHEGVVIWESSAITMYLGETFGVDKGLWPSAGPRRGEAMKWVAWTNVTLGEAVYRRGHNGDWAAPEDRNQKAADQATKDISELLAILDQALAGKEFLVGEYTLADTHLNSFCDWLRHSQIEFGPFTNLNAWSERCAARPAYKKVMGAAGA